MPLEGLRWSRDSGSTLCDTPQNGRSRTGWWGEYPIRGFSGDLSYIAGKDGMLESLRGHAPCT